MVVDFKERKVRLGNKKNRAREMRYRWIEMNDELLEVLEDQFKTRLPQSDYVFKIEIQGIQDMETVLEQDDDSLQD